MDLAARKYKFIEQLSKITTAEQLEKLEHFFSSEIAKSQNTLPDIAQQLLKQSKTEATK